MTDRVRMTSQTVFANERITVFTKEHPEGVQGGSVVVGQEFETDLAHAKDLDRLDRAKALNPADLEGEARLEPGYQVSVPQMKAQDPDWTPGFVPGSTTGAPAAGGIVDVPAEPKAEDASTARKTRVGKVS